MKLSVKLFGGFGIVVSLVVGVGLFAIAEMGAIRTETELLAGDWLPSIARLGQINESVNEFRRYELVHVLSTDEAQMRDYVERMKTAKEKVTRLLAEYEKLVTPDQAEEHAELRKFLELWKSYQGQHEKIAKLSEINQTKAAELATGESAKLLQQALASLNKLVAMNTKGGEVSAAKALEEYSSGRIKLLLAIALCVAAGAALAFFITRNVRGQLGEDPGYLGQVAAEVAGGNLDVAFKPVEGKGGVYAVLIRMVSTLKEKIGEANQKTEDAASQAQAAREATAAAEEATARAERAKAEGMLQAAVRLEDVAEVISSASEELSAQVEQSTRGAELQTGRVAETATAMEQMNATVLEVARNASQAAETSEQAKARAQEGAKAVDEVVREIGTVAKQAEGLKTDMTGLGAQAEAIGRIMGVISDIADQTNLLALNAAIEAARAGEAGRGFAVVADEVRKLAEKTMTATKEVGEAIRGIQDGTRSNIASVERTVTLVGKATSIASASGEALRAIVELVDRSTDQVRSIAAASEEQSAASEEINHSVEDISRISSETSDAMRQSAQAVAELAAQAQVLSRLIGELQAEGGGPGGEALPGRVPAALGM
ncbi:MAG: methyl-accepting chemotaxis protein [Acidobacteriota bacterium]